MNDLITELRSDYYLSKIKNDEFWDCLLKEAVRNQNIKKYLINIIQITKSKITKDVEKEILRFGTIIDLFLASFNLFLEERKKETYQDHLCIICLVSLCLEKLLSLIDLTIHIDLKKK